MLSEPPRNLLAPPRLKASSRCCGSLRSISATGLQKLRHILAFIGGSKGCEITVFGEDIFETFIHDFIRRCADESGVLIDLRNDRISEPDVRRLGGGFG